ncbi:nucleotide exchange factor GrpE [Bacteroidota bacterium]
MKKRSKQDEKVEETQTDNEEMKNDASEDETQTNKIDVEIKEKVSDAEESEVELTDEQKVQKYEEEIATLKDTLLRKAAEFENYKRRNENDQANIFKYAAEGFILSILPVYDDLERSLAHIDDDNNIKSVKDGLKMVFDKFSKILEDQGIKKIESIGKPFDFNYHEALMQREEESVPSHTVLEEIEAGYMYKDKVLRHSKVIVSQEPASNEEENNSDEENETNRNEDNN